MVTIEKTIPAQAETLFDIHRQAFRPLYEQFHDTHNPYLRTIEDITRRLDDDMFRYFTIRYDGEIVGGIFYRTRGGGPFFGELQPGEYYLQRLYIRPDMQGKKIAQTAIRLCEEYLGDGKRFFVDFPAPLEKNRRCYEGSGFKDTGFLFEAEPGMTLKCYEKNVNE